ncbi:MAG: CHAT domain-containing protein [Vicinamibacterales bacterium]
MPAPEPPSGTSGPATRPAASSAAWLSLSAAVTATLVWCLFGATTGIERLVAAMHGVPRPVEGRLSGGFAYAPLAVPVRGDTPPAPGWRVLEEAARAQDAADRDPSASHLHALGLAALNAGHYDAAVQALEDAGVADAGRAAVQSDLAAAYLARAAVPGHAIDLARAVEAANRAIHLAPTLREARFNYALALTALHLSHEGERAWNDYLEVSLDDGWAHEARQRRDALLVPPDDPPSSPAAEADAILGRWAGTATEMPDEAVLPDVQRYGPFYVAVSGVIGASRGDGRRRIAHVIEMLFAADRAVAAANYSEAEQLAGRAQADTPDVESPLWLWAERVRLTTGFNSRRGVDVRARAERLAGIAKARGFTALESDGRHRLGALDYVSGSYDQAIREYGRAVSLRQALHDTRREASSRLALGDGLNKLGRFTEAWEQYGWILRAHPGDAGLRFSLVAGPALASLDQGLAATAVALTREAEDIATGIGHAGLLTTARGLQARALVRLHRLGDANDALERSRNSLADLPDPAMRERYLADFSQAEADVVTAQSPERGIPALVEAQRRLGGISLRQRLLALKVQQARAHRALGDVAAARRVLLEAVANVDEQQRQIARQDYLPSFIDASWDAFSELVDLEADAGETEAALRWLDRGFDVRRRWAGPTPAVSLALASRDGPVVAYLARPDGLWVWVVVEGRAHQRRVTVTRDVLERRAARLAHVITLEGAADAAEDAAAGLARDVWWPIAGLLQRGGDVAPRVALVLDPALQHVPFAALPWGAGDARRIVDVTATVRCPSVSACGPTAPLVAARAKVSVLYSADGGDGFAPLSAARDEAARIGRRYAGSAVERATAAAFHEALNESTVVHYAGHALADERDPIRSALLLAGENGAGVRVPLSAFLDGTAHARLVVLSACRTSRAQGRRGEGATGVAGEFLRAGVDEVVAAQWDVRDDAAGELMDHLHEALAEGAPPWTALRVAQQRMLADGRRPARDWAAYVAFTSASQR